jgi:hypothetical protein
MFIATSASLILAAQVIAGPSFRLEIGPPVASMGAGKVKNAVLLVRPLACDHAASVVVTGTAEGIVAGARQSIALKLQRLPTPGVHAVARQWPEGRWVVTLTGTCPGRNATASALVPLDATSRFDRGKTQLLDRAVTAEDVAVVLRSVSGTN